MLLDNQGTRIAPTRRLRHPPKRRRRRSATAKLDRARRLATHRAPRRATFPADRETAALHGNAPHQRDWARGLPPPRRGDVDREGELLHCHWTQERQLSARSPRGAQAIGDTVPSVFLCETHCETYRLTCLPMEDMLRRGLFRALEIRPRTPGPAGGMCPAGLRPSERVMTDEGTTRLSEKPKKIW